MRLITLLTHLGALSAVLAVFLQEVLVAHQEEPQSSLLYHNDEQKPLKPGAPPEALSDMLKALSTMQDTYFSLQSGTWPKAIDWTAAVMATHVSAALTGIVLGSTKSEHENGEAACLGFLGLENIVNKYFAQKTVFYYNENAFGLRNQANDDMLWVVLDWLDNIKFSHIAATRASRGRSVDSSSFHGVQFSPLAAHRARIFYELADRGWDEQLCGGGMIWNPRLEPYKNSITNELYTAASIAMYLYFPGDNNTLPFMTTGAPMKAHDPLYLKNAIKSYAWLRNANLLNPAGLFHDGYHIDGWKKFKNGTVDPGTKKCDKLDKMIYTYNQGVILSASRGLWIATGIADYLMDGHRLIGNTIKATGWPRKDRKWKGLGRGGVMEEFCDHKSQCSQDAQTFKGVFFLHMTEFCRPLEAQEKEVLINLASSAGFDKDVYDQHIAQCKSYGSWIDHNAAAALKTRNKDGLFGMWWNVPATASEEDQPLTEGPQELPDGVVDHRSPPMEPASQFQATDPNDRGRGRTVETQSGGLAVLRAKWHWQSVLGQQV